MVKWLSRGIAKCASGKIFNNLFRYQLSGAYNPPTKIIFLRNIPVERGSLEHIFSVDEQSSCTIHQFDRRIKT